MWLKRKISNILTLHYYLYYIVNTEIWSVVDEKKVFSLLRHSAWLEVYHHNLVKWTCITSYFSIWSPSNLCYHFHLDILKLSKRIFSWKEHFGHQFSATAYADTGQIEKFFYWFSKLSFFTRFTIFFCSTGNCSLTLLLIWFIKVRALFVQAGPFGCVISLGFVYRTGLLWTLKFRFYNFFFQIVGRTQTPLSLRWQAGFLILVWLGICVLKSRFGAPNWLTYSNKHE
jgi:hypothetical protein